MGKPCLAAYFADELNRFRPLTEREEARLYDALCRGGLAKRRWTEDDNLALATMRALRLEAPEIAQRMGRTPWAVRSRVRQISRKERERVQR